MILGSHNSWSYLPVRKWWMKLLAFTARCQNIDIHTQYEYGVRCFDLRLRFDSYHHLPIISHGKIQYKYTPQQLKEDLEYINSKGDCYVRILHEVRNKKEYTASSKKEFVYYCYAFQKKFPNIKFWCGRNLYNWEYDFRFNTEEPSCGEYYASVRLPKIIDDWWPWLYARLNNKKIKSQSHQSDILLLDYVNI